MTSKWNGAPGTTPGPWVATERHEFREIIGPRERADWFGTKESWAVAYCDTDREESEQDANAHQIAASGALYDATELLDSLCAWMLHRFGPDSPEGREASLRQAKAIAALALARGTS